MTELLAEKDGWWLLGATVFYPGGGGQPPDMGHIITGEREWTVLDVRSEAGGIWHRVERPDLPGARITCRIDWNYRHALMRHHALLHIVNTIALRRYQGLVTGALIRPDLSRIDLSMHGFERTMLPALEADVNEILSRNLSIRATKVAATELRKRPDLIRTRTTLPPVDEGSVRVVEIEGFDAQACGGTHVHSTGEIGRAILVDFANKGRNNKRIYWRIEPEAASPVAT